MHKISKIVIIAGVILAAIGIAVLLYFVSGKSTQVNLSSVAVKNGDITETINLTGQVKASQGVDLSFNSQGKIVADYVKVGDKIYAGQTLAVLNQDSAMAALTGAKGALAQAQANYNKLLAGAAQQNIQTAQDAVSLAKQNLASAYSGGINTLNNAYTAMYNAYNATLSMQNNYFVTQDPEGIAVSNAKNDINTNMQAAEGALNTAENSMTQSDIDAAVSQAILALNKVYDDVNIVRAQCDQGVYYYKITAADKASLDSQKTSVNAALTGVTVLQQSIASLKIAFQTSQDQLSVTTAPPTQENVDLAKAQILSAQGQVDAAQAVVNNTIISAPFSGQVDKDNAVIGQLVSPGVPVITISNNNLEIDTNIPEINLPGAKVGNQVNATLDAFGNGTIFPATIISIDLAPSIANGISVYGAKLKFTNQDARVTPGMTANITVISATHSNVLLVPKSAVIEKNNSYFVVVDKGNSQKEVRAVTIGLEDNNNIEITSGLKLGEKVFAY